MATVGPYYSSEYTLLYRTLPADVAVHRNARSTLRIEEFTFTQASTGTINDQVFLCKVPGSCRLILPLCFVYFTDWTAATVLDIGWGAHYEPDGDLVAADDDGLVDGLDISQGGVGIYFGQVTTVTTVNTLIQIPAAKIDHAFNSRTPVDITATIAGAAPVAAGVIKGFMVYCI